VKKGGTLRKKRQGGTFGAGGREPHLCLMSSRGKKLCRRALGKSEKWRREKSSRSVLGREQVKTQGGIA